MMKKALWALALLFLVSGCDDKDKDPVELRPDPRVTTTFYVEYNLNYGDATSSPATYTEVPVMPSSGSIFRVIVELHRVIEDPQNPDAEPTYQFYDRQIFWTGRHMLNDNGNLILYGSLKLDKLKYKAIAWGDYSTFTYDNWGYLTYPDVNFNTNPDDKVNKGLRYISETNITNPNSSFINEGGVYGHKEFDLTIYEGEPISSAKVEMSLLSRPFGAISLIATDFDQYKAQAPSDEFYQENYRPARSTANFGTYDKEGAPNSGYATYYNVFDEKIVDFTNDVTKRYTIGNPVDGKLIIARYFLFTDPNKTEQDDVTIMIYTAKGGGISQATLPPLPLEPNKLLELEGPFLTGQGNFDNNYTIRIFDRFDGKYEPVNPDDLR